MSLIRGLNWFADLTGVAISEIADARVNGMSGIHGIGIIKTGSNFSANIEVSPNGVDWFVFATITHASTTLAFDLGRGWPQVRVNITADVGADVDLDAWAVGLDHSSP